MRPKNIEARKRKKRGAVVSVLLFALLQIGCAASFGALCFIPDLPKWLFIPFLILAAFCLLLILPALWVLKKRFDEIEGGESDAAAEY